MLTIYEYPIPIQDHIYYGHHKFTLGLPKDAKILTIQIQMGTPRLWVMGDPKTKKENRYFRLVDTDHPLGDDYLRIIKYIGTFQIENGALLFHLFEIKGDD